MSDAVEEDEGRADAGEGVQEDPLGFAGGWEGAGAVGAEGDPVGCYEGLLSVWRCVYKM